MNNCPKCHRRTMYSGLPGEQKCLCCGMRIYDNTWQEEETVISVPSKRQPKANMAEYKECEVCGAQMRVSTNRPWCSYCETKMRAWRGRGEVGPVPIIQIDGRWQKNPEWKGRNNPRTGAKLIVKVI